MKPAGQKRTQADAAGASTRRAEAEPAVRRPVRCDDASGVTLTYTGSGGLVLRGPRSGRTYQALATGDLVFVHPDDVDGLLRMGNFRRRARRNQESGVRRQD